MFFNVYLKKAENIDACLKHITVVLSPSDL